MIIFNIAKYKFPVIASAFMLSGQTILSANLLQQEEKVDSFEKVSYVSPTGVINEKFLEQAPSSKIEICGETHNAKIIVDLSKNILYKYNEFGVAEEAYLVASGKKKTPTDTGIRVVSHIESYPYKLAPTRTKRYRNPRAYGPRVICLEKIDVKTGAKSPTGEFIHGNNNSKSLGEYASHGCVRMDNKIIKKLSEQVKRGDIVVITKNEN